MNLMKDPRVLPSEEDEQTMLFNWAQMQSGKYPELKLMFHIPNGGQRSKTEAKRFKAAGVKAGVPDIFLPVARAGWHGMFIEMKRSKGGRVSDEQNEWMFALMGEGYFSFIAHGWEPAAQMIIKYLDGELIK